MCDREDGGYRIHDFLTYQFSAQQVRAEREKAKDRMADLRSRRRAQRVRPNDPGTSGDVTRHPIPPVLSEQGRKLRSVEPRTIPAGHPTYQKFDPDAPRCVPCDGMGRDPDTARLCAHCGGSGKPQEASHG